MSTKDVLNKTWEEDPIALIVVLLLGFIIGLIIMYLICDDTRRTLSFPKVSEQSRVNFVVSTPNKNGSIETVILGADGKLGIEFETPPNNRQVTQNIDVFGLTNYEGSWCRCWTQNGKTTCFPNAQHCR